MPIKRMMPTKAMTVSGVLDLQRQRRRDPPKAVEMMVRGWARLSEHAQHDVHRHQRAEDQQRLAPLVLLKSPALPSKLPRMPWHSVPTAPDIAVATERHIGQRLNTPSSRKRL
jgi:hypothetical protein